MKTALSILLGVGVIACGAWGLWWLHQNTARLQRQAAELRRRHHAGEQQRAENVRLQSLAAQVERGDAAAAETVRIELDAARQELAALEERAREGRAKMAERAATLENNRDPTMGITRLEHFRNVGRTTPLAAFQTLVWAALQGDETVLTAALSVSGEARDKAAALIARLPEDARKKFPSPERLAAVAVTGEMLKGGALHIAGTTPVDGATAMLAVRTSAEGREARLPMTLGPGGWQVVVPERAIAGIEKRMVDLAPEGLPKK